jgi:hypothetical protein
VLAGGNSNVQSRDIGIPERGRPVRFKALSDRLFLILQRAVGRDALFPVQAGKYSSCIDDASHAAAHRRPKPHQALSGPTGAASRGTVMSKLLSYFAITTIAVASAIATTQAYADDTDSPAVVTYESTLAFSEQPFVLSRAEVLADLQLWKASGLAELQNGYTSEVFGAQYQRASARYAALRMSPHFAELVQSIAAQRGDVVAGTTPNRTQAVQ